MALIEEFVAGRTPSELYEAYLTPLFETWSEVLIEASPPKGRALDVACGTGIVARKLMQQPGVESVTGIDIAGPMIETARSATDPNADIEYHQASASQINFPEGHFQSAYCQQGLQFFPDKPSALQETARLLETGSRAVYSVWTSASDGNPVFDAFERIVAQKLGPEFVPFGPFSFGSKPQLQDLVESSGLALVSLEKRERPARLPDPRTLVLFDLLFLGRPAPDGGMHPLYDPADSSKDDQIGKIILELAASTEQFVQPDGSLLAPSSTHIIVLEKR